MDITSYANCEGGGLLLTHIELSLSAVYGRRSHSLILLSSKCSLSCKSYSVFIVTWSDSDVTVTCYNTLSNALCEQVLETRIEPTTFCFKANILTAKLLHCIINMVNESYFGLSGMEMFKQLIDVNIFPLIHKCRFPTLSSQSKLIANSK